MGQLFLVGEPYGSLHCSVNLISLLLDGQASFLYVLIMIRPNQPQFAAYKIKPGQFTTPVMKPILANMSCATGKHVWFPSIQKKQRNSVMEI